MIEVKDGNKTIYFVRQADANNYNDYLKNGLKVIRQNNKTYYFNNGDVMYDVSLPAEKKKRYVLHHHNKKIISDKLLKKHIQAIEQ